LESIWSATASLKQWDPLREDIQTDVLVIGGGMAGILCAHALQNAGRQVVVAEGRRVGGGVTQNTTAQLNTQQGLIFSKFIKAMGREKTSLFIQANQQAIEVFRALSRTIDCDLEDKDAHLFSRTDRQGLEEEVQALQSLGIKAEFLEELPLPVPIAGAVRFPSQAQFHPLRFLEGISRNLRIYENTFVKGLEGTTAYTDRARIRAKRIIVATHFPFLNTHGTYFLKMYQHRSYVIALKAAPDLEGMYLEETMDGLYFRNARGMLLLGGGDHRTGKQGGNWQVLRELAREAYPQAQEQYAWATQDCMTLDEIPYIGPYSPRTPGLYVATGFNKWGMTGSMISAMLLTDLINGKRNEFAPVFDPSRSMALGQLLLNVGSALAGMAYPTAKRCPHLGCGLRWNPIEHTWDCPCHGSRFTQKGSLIDNPATGGIFGEKGKVPTGDAGQSRGS